MPDIKQLLKQLASHPKTSPSLLRALSLEDAELQSAIAGNPNCDLELLNNFSISHPEEVLSNPVVLLAEAGHGNGYAGFTLKSLASLCMACDPNAHAALLCETRSRIAEGINELQGQDEASLSCAWLYERAFTLSPNQCNNLIGEPIDLEIRVKSPMQGSGPISFKKLPELEEGDGVSIAEMRQELKAFFMAISSGSIDNYFDADFTLEDGGSADCDVRAKSLPRGLSLDGETLYKVVPDGDFDWEESLLEFEHTYASTDEPICLRKECHLVVPVVFAGEIDHEYDITMGELGDLIGLKIHSSETGLEINWPKRLAELLVAS